MESLCKPSPPQHFERLRLVCVLSGWPSLYARFCLTSFLREVVCCSHLPPNRTNTVFTVSPATQRLSAVVTLHGRWWILLAPVTHSRPRSCPDSLQENQSRKRRGMISKKNCCENLQALSLHNLLSFYYISRRVSVVILAVTNFTDTDASRARFV